jgi:hypothetical protein
MDAASVTTLRTRAQIERVERDVAEARSRALAAKSWMKTRLEDEPRDWSRLRLEDEERSLD